MAQCCVPVSVSVAIFISVFDFIPLIMGEGRSVIYYILLTALLALAVVSDIKTYRIPNVLNAFGCLTGMMYGVLSGGTRGLFRSLIGIVVPVLMLMVLFFFRIVGAGDIKLLSAIGSFVSLDITKIIVISFILTAVYGIGISVLKCFRIFPKPGFTKIHLSVPIVFGTILYVAGGVFLEL